MDEESMKLREWKNYEKGKGERVVGEVKEMDSLRERNSRKGNG